MIGAYEAKVTKKNQETFFPVSQKLGESAQPYLN